MTVQKLRNRLAVYLVGGHFILLILVLLCPGLAFEKSIDLMTIMGPLFAGFTTVIIKYFVSTPAAAMSNRSTATQPLAFFAFLIPTCLYLAILFIVIRYARGELDIKSFETVKISIAGFEAMFGVYIGFVVDGLFKERSLRPSN